MSIIVTIIERKEGEEIWVFDENINEYISGSEREGFAFVDLKVLSEKSVVVIMKGDPDL